MSVDTNVILKFRREHDSWVCSECDAENFSFHKQCVICGHMKDSADPVLKMWTEADEYVPQAKPVEKSKGGSATGKSSAEPAKKAPSDAKKVFADDGYAPEEKKSKIGLKIFIAIVVIIAILAGTFVFIDWAEDGKLGGKIDYSDGMDAYGDGDYVEALRIFQSLPMDDNVEEMINKCLCKEAEWLIDEGKYEEAKTYIDQLPGDYDEADDLKNTYNYKYASVLIDEEKYSEATDLLEELPENYEDSEDLLNKCKYAEAKTLYDDGDYKDARDIFKSLSSYSDSSRMINECDYQLAVEYMDEGEYIKAMKAFKDLGSFKDSSTQFTKAEGNLTSENRSNGYYTDEEALVGEWTDSSGDNYVNYTKNSDGSITVTYNIDAGSGSYFKVENGVHYHGDDRSGWSKQWIFQRVSSYRAKVYNYIDGEIYELSNL